MKLAPILIWVVACGCTTVYEDPVYFNNHQDMFVQQRQIAVQKALDEHLQVEAKKSERRQHIMHMRNSRTNVVNLLPKEK